MNRTVSIIIGMTLAVLLPLDGWFACSWLVPPAFAAESLLMDRYNGPAIQGENYLSQVNENGRWIRWSLLHMPLKLSIDSEGPVTSQNNFKARVRAAMAIWSQALPGQLSYVVVDNPDDADINIHERANKWYMGHQGLTKPIIEQNQLKAMNVQIAMFDVNGQPLTQDKLSAVILHELGHSLGLLGHSPSPNDVMYVHNTQTDHLSSRDINTLGRLYSRDPDISNLPEKSNRAITTTRLDEQIARMQSQIHQKSSALNWLNLGIAYFQKGQQLQDRSLYEQAIEATAHALQIEPRNAEAYHQRSLYEQALGQFPVALQNIQTAMALKPAAVDYYLLQAWYLANLNRLPEAKQSLGVYLAQKPEKRNSEDVVAVEALLRSSF